MERGFNRNNKSQILQGRKRNNKANSNKVTPLTNPNHKMKRTFASYERVIELLKAGCEIYTRRNEYLGRKDQLIYSARIWEVSDCNKISELIHHQTIEKLKNNKVILSEKPYTFLNPKTN